MNKKICCTFTALLAAFFLVACGAPQTEPPDPVPPDEEPGSFGAEVWTLPSSVKVLREEDCSEYYTENAELRYAMAKNEYESMQLMVTPETDIDSFTLETSDLSGPGNATISKEKIEVYNEFYVYIQKGTAPDTKRAPGWYPDALIPQDLSVEYGENGIAEGDNQGIWITIKTEKDTPAGTYTGTFKLKIDDKSREIPVTVEVWDF
ncbi:MAG: glycoside hydrolase domain-containing protein, partial [Candidatus Gallimonas sp.]